MKLWRCTMYFLFLVINTFNIVMLSAETVNIPEIDVGLFMHGSNEVKLQLSKQFDSSFHEWGAVRFINHSIPSLLTTNLFDGSKAFFAKNLPYKLQHKYGSKQGSPGFCPFGSEITENSKGVYNIYNTSDNYSPNIDKVESFVIINNWDNITDIDIQSGNIYIPKYNTLPLEFKYYIPEYWMLFRELTKYLHSMASIALLGLDKNNINVNNNIFEQNMTQNALFEIRLSNYPSMELSENESENGVRFGTHQDYTGFTLIQNDLVSGLQISVNDTWYDVQPKYDSLIVVGGEYIERWTNKYWLSTPHRVIYNKVNMNKQRLSIIVFTSPNMGIDIQVLSECEQCTKHEKVYEPINGFQLLNERFEAASYGSEYDNNDMAMRSNFEIAAAESVKREL
eukprot:509154_1